MRWCLAAVFAASLLIVPAAEAQTAAPDVATLPAIETQVSRSRGLPPTAEPAMRVLDNAGPQQLPSDAYDTDYPPNERELDQQAWVTLGLIKSTGNLVQ